MICKVGCSIQAYAWQSGTTPEYSTCYMYISIEVYIHTSYTITSTSHTHTKSHTWVQCIQHMLTHAHISANTQAKQEDTFYTYHMYTYHNTSYIHHITYMYTYTYHTAHIPHTSYTCHIEQHIHATHILYVYHTRCFAYACNAQVI